MNVELVDLMGTDLTVVNAARVSFDKESRTLGEHFIDDGEIVDILCQDFKPNATRETIIHNFLQTIGMYDRVLYLDERDKKLIAFLAREGHWSPFAHCSVQFRVKAPIFIARQLGKHQVGLSWNEVSRRYVDSEPEFYTPSTWRQRVENKKQGSGGEIHEDFIAPVNGAYETTVKVATSTYDALLAAGVCPEQARMVLPQSMMTEWFWSGSLFAFARVCRERLASDAQKENHPIVEQIAEHCGRLFPVSWKELVSGPQGQGQVSGREGE